MGLTRCGNFLKYSMFIFNFIILICGSFLLGVGIYTRANHGEVCITTLGSNLFLPFALTLISVGSIIIVMSFLGCCGAIKEVRCMLATFFALLLLMLIVLMIGGIIAYVFRGQITNYFREHLYTSLNNSYGKDERETHAWDCMQRTFKCCGVEGGVNSTTSWAYYSKYTEWFANQTSVRRPYGSYIQHELKMYVPKSCCKDEIKAGNVSRCTGISDKDIAPALGPPVYPNQMNDQLYVTGCFSTVSSFLWENAKIIGAAASGIAVLMVLGMTFSLCLCRRIDDEYAYEWGPCEK